MYIYINIYEYIYIYMYHVWMYVGVSDSGGDIASVPLGFRGRPAELLLHIYTHIDICIYTSLYLYIYR